jgi:acyl-CoA dehydrogenase
VEWKAALPRPDAAENMVVRAAMSYRVHGVVPRWVMRFEGRVPTMFSLKPTEAQAGLDKQIRAVAVERLRPRGLAAERERTVTPDLADELDKLGRQIHGTPELCDPLSALIALEALAFGDPGIAYAVLPSFQVAHLVRSCGSERQRERLLPRTGEIWSTASSLMFYEGYGRGQTELETEATQAGEGWTISGRKIAVHHPGVADVSVLLARSVAGGDAPAGLVGFACEGPLLGCQTESDSWQTGALGANVTSTGTVRLNEVARAEEQRLVADGAHLHRAVGYARLMLAAVQVGAAGAAVDYAGGYARERHTFGRPLISYQGVSFVLVDCETKVDAARLELWEAAQRLGELSDPSAIERLVGRAVRAATNTATQVTREGIQLLGVHGIVTEHPPERFWRHASTLSLIDFDPLGTPLSLV